MRIFLLGTYVSDYTTVYNLSALGYFIPVDEKQVLVPLMSLMTWKRRTISLKTPLLHLSLSGTFMRLRYSCDFHVSGQMTVFIMTSWRVRLPVYW